MSTESEQPPRRVRTSDAERESVAEALRTAVTEGRLTLQEGDERLAALYATKYRDELAPLLADLPGNDDRPPADGAPHGRRGHGPAAWGPRPWAANPGNPNPDNPHPGDAPAGWGSFPGFGVPGFDPRMWRRRRGFRIARLAIVAAVLITFFAFTGHFFWPIIPLFLLFNIVRLGIWHGRCHAHGQQGGWQRSGWNDGASQGRNP